MSATPTIRTAQSQRDDVLAVLGDLGLDEAAEDGLIEVMNKIDLLEPGQRGQPRKPHAAELARSPPCRRRPARGATALLALIDRRLQSDIRAVRLDVPLTDGKTLAWIYRHGEVLGRRDDSEAAHLSVRLSDADLARLRHHQRLH